MANVTIYQKISALSPHIEMINRRLYYFLKPIVDRFLKKKISNKGPKNTTNPNLDFNLIIRELKDRGLNSGDILVMHASFNELKVLGLSPIEIVNSLLDYLGPEGTLAMPSIAIYPEPQVEKDGTIKNIFDYDVKSTKIWTGAIAKAMISDPRSHRSLHPLNSMVAIGKHAIKMMEDNEKDPYPCGVMSSWSFCANRNAFVLGLGTDLTHSLTMIHVAEDTQGENWVVPNWYQDRIFRIINGENTFQLKVKERKYKWGKLHFAERNLAKELINRKVLKSKLVGNILIESLRSNELVTFLENRNIKGYPYFWV